MEVEGRVMRGLVDAMASWSRTGLLIEGSAFCRVRSGGVGVVVELGTQGGWLAVEVPGEWGDGESEWGLDVPMLLKVLKAASWPKVGDVGVVSLRVEGVSLRVEVPQWRKVGKGWVEAGSSVFRYPLGQGIWWDAGALPACPGVVCCDAAVTLEVGVLEGVVTGAGSCVASASDRGVLRCVELICRPDEVLGLGTDGGVVGLSSEPAALSVEGQECWPLDPVAVRVLVGVWKAAQMGSEVEFRPFEECGQRLLELRPRGGDGAFRVVLRLVSRDLPMDGLLGLPESTGVGLGQVADREGLLGQLELAAMNPDAKVVWLVWEGGSFWVCSHGPWMDMRHEVCLERVGAGDTEIAVEGSRIRTALDQLKAGGGRGPLTFAVDRLRGPGRLMVTQSDADTGQVRRVLVLATAGSSYEVFRARARERVLATAEANAKERRRNRYRKPPQEG